MPAGRYRTLYTDGRVKTEEEFFSEFDDTQSLTAEQEQEAYARYVMRALVLRRDGFACQNLNCPSDGTELTIHHIKAQRNGGKHDTRNGVALCRTCHEQYELGNASLVFPDEEHLPKKIRAHTFGPSDKTPSKAQLEKQAILHWKETLAKNKEIRRQCRFRNLRTTATWEQICLLMRFLFGEVE